MKHILNQNIMKKLFLKKLLFGLLLAFFVLMFSCKKEDDKIFLYLGKTELNFGYDNNSINLSISNISGKSLEWTVSSEDNFMYFSKSSGSLEPNSYEQIFINVKRSELTGDSISSEITISSIGIPVTIKVFILNYPENKIRLNYRINDAEYDKVNNRLFLLPTNCQYIEVFDVNEETFEKIDLQEYDYYNIKDIEVSSDGNYLVATSYNHLYHIDVEKKEVVFQCELNKQTESFVYAPNNKVYLFPDDYWDPDMYCIDLSSYQISTFDINGDETNAKPHPSWKYIYGINDYYSLLKIDIQTEIPELIYSEYINGIGKYLWIQGDGKKIITSQKKLLHINPDVSGYDVTVISDIDIPGYNYIFHVEYNTQKNEHYLIPSTYQDEIDNTILYVYDNELNFVREIELEQFFFTTTGNSYITEPAMALFAFSDTAGQKLIVLTQPKSGSYSQISAIEIISSNKKIVL